MKSRIVNKEEKEFYDECPKCKIEIRGSSEAMVIGNMKIHKDSKRCNQK